MNSQLYRIVFSRSRGVSVAVAEFTRARGKGKRSAATRRRGEGARPHPAGRNAAAMAMLTALGLGVPMGINAAIIADASAPQNQQPTVAVTANGTPQVNIQTPSVAGVSRNSYSQFDVDGRGAILNNSSCNTQTQIGGWVQGNPNLVHGSARIILNEVNSSLPSRLNGYVEVAGSRAEVVIANPSGISVNGGGFINASRTTLTTGTPLMHGGDLRGYSVEQGTIRIEGAGLDLAQTDYAAILARAVEVNAGVWAEQLKVIAGANHIDAGHDQITPVPAGVPQYVYALDVAHLGGMYAGKITLVGTEAGLGMRNAGEINAASDSLMLAADGMLSNTGTMSARHTVVTVAGLENRGLIDGQETHIHAASLTNVGGGRIYGDRVAIAAHTLVNDAESVGGEIRAAVIAARDRLDIGAGTIRNREQSALFSAGDLHVGGTLDADGHAVGSADELHNTSAFIESLGNMGLSATGLYNTNEHYAAEVRRIAGPSSVSWSSGNFQYSVTRSEYRTTVVEGRPGQILAGGDMHITGSVLFNDKSLILAGGSLGGDLDRLQNIDAQGVHVVSDSGYSRYRYEQCVIYWPWPASGCAYSESRWSSWVPYNPADRVTSVSLNIANTAEHTAVAGTGTALPGLYTVNLANPGTPVIETDPRFADYRTWLGSDYMLAALELEPTGVLRRLGDGFYEQSLIRDQIAAQTGQRYLAGHDNDEAQFRALMDNGITAAAELQLRPGIALTAQQVARLTSDIVWLVEQEVRLADGSIVRALVPQVYARVRDGDLDASGTLIAGRNIMLAVEDVLHNSGTLAAHEGLAVESGGIENSGGRIHGDSVVLLAREDIDNIGGTIIGGGHLALVAGRDLNVVTTTRSDANLHGASSYSQTNIDRAATLYVSKSGGMLLASAGRDVNLTAAAIANDGAGGETVIDAGRDILLGTVTVGRQDNTVWNAVTHVKKGHNQDAGTEIAVAGDVRLRAGNDVAATAGQVVSRDGELSVTAGNDIRLQAGQASEMSDIAYQDTSYSLFSSKTTTIRDAHADTRAVGSTLSAERVDMLAGRNMDISGSQVVASRDVSLRAQGDITLASASDTSEEVHFKDVSESGLFSGGGLSVTYGTRQQSTDAQSRQLTAARSTVGSLDGQVQIEAGGRYEQQGSDVLAPQGDIDITARDIAVLTTEEHASTRLENRYRQTGVTLTLTSPLITALETGQRMARAARETGDDRLKTLAASASGLAAYDAYVQYQQNPAQAGGLNISLSLGTSQSASTTVQTRQGAAGSGIAAGRDVRLSARRSEEQGGDILIVGSGVSAGNDASLQADNDIHLLAAQDIHTRQSSNNSSGASVGIGFRVGGQSNGFTLNIGLNEGRGQADGTDILHTHSQIQAGNTANVHSGGDTTLKGAVVEGRQVIAQVGGDLTIESVQDTSTYDSKQSSSGIGVSLCIPPFCYGTSSGSVSMSDSRAQGAYASVAAQSGIRAGDGGFDIEVRGNTGLNGGLIASDADTEHNRLVTTTLTTEDLANRAETSASASGLSLSSDMLTQGKYGLTKALVANTQLDAERSGSSSGQTRSAIATGEVVITDNERQQQLTGHSAEDTVAMLNRDTDAAHTAAQKQDVEGMQRQVEAEREIKQAVYAEAVKFTDESYRTMFVKKADIYQVERDQDGRMAMDENGNPVMRALSEEEKRNLQPGADGKPIIFTNGIFNDEVAAGNYAVQMSEIDMGEKVYLIYFPEAGNGLSEFLVAGYQKYLENDFFGLANTTQETRAIMQQYGETGLSLIGHSRGAMTIGNAMESLERMPASVGSLYDTDIKLVGPAYSARQAANLLDTLSDGFGQGINLQNHADDFVGTLIGGNPATYSKRPNNGDWQHGAEDIFENPPVAGKLVEWVRIFGDAPTVHGCYGSGAAHKDCTKNYGKAPTMNIQAERLK